MTRLVVVGGDAAGMSAAAEARRADPALEIVVLERGDDVAYAACGLPYWLAGVVESERRLVAHEADYFREQRRIDVRTGAEAVAVDPERRIVSDDRGGETAYDHLVLATGARPVRPPVPGIDLPGVATLRDLPDARALRALLDAGVRRALVVGSGPLGIEVAEALSARGVDVELIEVAPRLLPVLAPEIAESAVGALRVACATARPGATLEAIAPAGRGLVATVDGAAIACDLVVLATGVAPNAALAEGAGCALGERGAVLVDRRCRTTVPGIWAAGDCATAWHRVLERDVWAPFATTATRQGRVAGRDLAGVPASFAGVLGSWVSTGFGVGFGATGVDVAQAHEAGFDPRAIIRAGGDRSGYIPGAEEIRVRLVWDDTTGRLLGGQVSGAGEVSTRLHTLATAIGAGMTIRDLAEADFGYVPPLSALRDPIELAAAAAVGDAR